MRRDSAQGVHFLSSSVQLRREAAWQARFLLALFSTHGFFKIIFVWHWSSVSLWQNLSWKKKPHSKHQTNRESAKKETRHEKTKAPYFFRINFVKHWHLTSGWQNWSLKNKTAQGGKKTKKGEEKADRPWERHPQRRENKEDKTKKRDRGTTR